MKQFVLGATTMLVALVVALLALVWSVGSPGSGADVDVPTASPTPRPSALADVARGETWLREVRLTSSQVVTGDGGLTDVTAIGSGVTLTTDGLRAQRLDLDASLPFATAAAQIGGGVTLFAADDGSRGFDAR